MTAFAPSATCRSVWAKAVIAYGTCATAGGIQAAAPNPTESKGIRSYIGAKPYIAVPGCPPIPEVMTGVVMHVALFGTLPPLDGEGRPRQFYGNRIHDTCYRRPFFDAGMFADRFDDAGAKAGWCLYHLGCRGPETYNSCGNLRWYQGMSYPIQSGAPCIGCSNANFWDQAPFSKRLPEYNGIDAIWSVRGLPWRPRSVLRRMRERASCRRSSTKSSWKKRESRCMNETRCCRPDHPH